MGIKSSQLVVNRKFFEKKPKSAGFNFPVFWYIVVGIETSGRATEMTLKNLEQNLDWCNHLMELLRTCLALCTLILQVVILLKLFDVI